MGAVSANAIAHRVVLGELTMDGSIQLVSGVWPAAFAAIGGHNLLIIGLPGARKSILAAWQNQGVGCIDAQ